MEKCSHIHWLTDELLMEILLRLPNCKYVTQCKLICKRWAAVVSQPCFIRLFIGLKVGDGDGGIDLNKEHQTFGFVMKYDNVGFSRLQPEFDHVFKPSIFHIQSSSFTPLYCPGDDNASTMVASCHDLLLYCRHGDNKCDLYISNVQTRHWVQLPSPPHKYGRGLVMGLLCDPFYSCDREVVVNASYRCSVVVLCCAQRTSNKLVAHSLSGFNNCGTGNQWCEKVLSLQKTCRLLGSLSCSFCFDGKLHITCFEGFFGFDNRSIQYDGEIRCHLVEWPLAVVPLKNHIDVSQGTLHVSAFIRAPGTLKVWVLKDYERGNWTLRHCLNIHEWVSDDSWMIKKLVKFRSYAALLGFHPNSSDVLYVLVHGSIFSCNLSTKILELARHIPVAKHSKDYMKRITQFPIIFRSWPTPLPLFPLAQPQGEATQGYAKVSGSEEPPHMRKKDDEKPIQTEGSTRPAP